MRMNRTIDTVEVHTSGRAFRLVTRGLPDFTGATLAERRAWLARNADHWRRALFLAPRGHAALAGAYLTGPVSERAHLGLIFVDADGYSEQNPDGVIAAATVAVALGWVERAAPETRVGIDVPDGYVDAFVKWDGGHAGAARVVMTQASAALAPYAHAAVGDARRAGRSTEPGPEGRAPEMRAQGSARICGFANWLIDESDPFTYGCVV